MFEAISYQDLIQDLSNSKNVIYFPNDMDPYPPEYLWLTKNIWIWIQKRAKTDRIWIMTLVKK